MGDKQLLYFLPPSGRVVLPNAVQLPTDYQHETWPSLRKKEGGYKIKMKKKLYFNVYVSRSAILVGGILLDVRRNQKTFFKDIVIWRLNLLIWDGWMVYYGDKRTTLPHSLWNWKSKKFCTKNNFFRDLKKMRQRRIIQSNKCRIARNCTFMVNVECAKSL